MKLSCILSLGLHCVLLAAPTTRLSETQQSAIMEGNEEDNSIERSILDGLNQLHKFFINKPLSQAHCLFLAVYVIGIQVGFIPQNFFLNRLMGLTQLESWSTFKKSNVEICCNQAPTYEYDSPHETFFTENFITAASVEEDDILKSKLVALVTGDFMMVTLSPHPSTQSLGRSTCLSIGRYVIKYSDSEIPLESCYQKLNQLQMQLRNELFVPVRISQLTLLDASPLPSFMGIPRELRFEVYKYLKSTDLKKLAWVNKAIQMETKLFSTKNNSLTN
ncbi:protein nutcracker isoform X1 [Ceratitis capitata]|uniref:protein nutcracker isoform X1 n=2 Tax=Ceratitis capitata TaxID=7213 RepID=UPI000A0F5C64|nr:protein nutcracker isoform X1 [Ceratitis capitata]